MAKGSLDDKKGSAEVKKMPVKTGIFFGQNQMQEGTKENLERNGTG